jgi:hypothetical protein
VSLAKLALSYGRMRPRDEQIWSTIAFLGRYGHQPVDALMRLSVVDLNRLASEVSSIVHEENAAGRRSEDD